MELVAAHRSGARVSSSSAALSEHHPDVLVDFSIPSTAVENIRTAVAAGVHVVVGTTGL